MPISSALTGHCLCGAVRNSAGPPLLPPTYCHCESCRRAAGAHAVAWITVAADSLRYTASSPRLIESSVDVRRTFCGQCGSQLTYWNATRADEIDVTIGTLDDPAPYSPADHIWMQDAPPWDVPHDGLPTHLQGRTGG